MMSREDQASALQARFGRAGAVAFEVSPLGGVVAVLSASGGGRAVVATAGGQVLSWVPEPGQPDVLWCSPLARQDTGKPVRGGIPVCWPWFGPHPDGAAKLPAHGLVRSVPWDIESVSVEAQQTAVLLAPQLTAGQQTIAGSGVSVAARVMLGADLEVELITTNSGALPFTLTEALHTYLAVEDIEAVRVGGLAGRTYLDQLTGREAVQDGTVKFAGETDRIYWDTSRPTVLHGAAPGRSISISSTGSASTVIWNPWRDKAARLGDMPPESYRAMVCAETANAGPRNVVTVAPGDVHRMACRISCTKS